MLSVVRPMELLGLLAIFSATDALAEEPDSASDSFEESQPLQETEPQQVAERREEEEAAALAEEQPSLGRSLLPDIHGFVSQGFIKTNQNNYLARSKRGSFEFNEVGINFTKQISERLRVGMQLFMRDLGPIGNYKPQFDWFYLDYNFFDWLGIRAGRTKIPFGLYNDVNDIDAARVPILLPQSVYPTQNRDFLLAQTGGELYGRIPLSVLGDLEYRIYGGTIFLDVSEESTVSNLDIPYVIGGRLMWETPAPGLRVGGTMQALSLDGDYVLTPEMLAGLQASGALGPEASNRVPFRIPALLWVTSLEYVYQDFLFAAEYSRWHVRVKSDEPAVVPPSDTTHERFYFMGSYRVAPWFSPGAYYSVFYPDVKERSGPGAKQHDIALTLRFDMNDHWLFKLEGHYMSGTAGLNPDLNAGLPRDELVSTWGALLAKTTAYF